MIRRITANFGWKLLSLAIAITLWFMIVGDPELTTTITVPVQYRRTSTDLEISSDVPHTVQLEIRGPSSKIASVLPSNTPVVLDLSNEQGAGERTFTITDDNVQLPPGVSLSRAIPAQLRLQLERRVAHSVPVQARFSSPPPQGYQIASVTSKPDHVVIRGPKSHTERIEFVETDPVDLSTVVSSAEFRVQTFVADPQVSLVQPAPVTVRVTVVKIAEPPAQKKRR